MDFIQIMFEKAKADLKTIVLPEGNDRRTLEAASIIQQRKIAKCIILGNEDEIKYNSQELNISQARIIDPNKFDLHEEYSHFFHDLRKLKGVSLDHARQIMLDPLYLGVMMVKLGQADGMVAGAINSTSNVLRPALQVIKTAPGTKMVSGFFVIVVPDCPYGHDGTFIFADSGLVEDPSAEEMAEIAITSAASFQTLFEIEPIVGMLSYSTYGSAKSKLTKKVIQATKLAQEKRPQLLLDGELQFDAAIIPEIGKSKAPASKIAGQANVLVFPDLNSGNIAYKVAQRLGGARAYGLITQGLAKPVNDLSRGCSAEDIVGVVAVTAVQAQALVYVQLRDGLYQLALDSGFSHAAWINSKDVPFAPELRSLCEQNSCGQYNTSWKGPPALGPVEELRQEFLRYENGLIVQTVGQLEDSFDYENMVAIKDLHQNNFIELVKQIKYKYTSIKDHLLALSVGCCDLCGECTYPNSPCIMPDDAIASVEAYGINVNAMLTVGGLKYNNGPNTVSYVGLILF